MSESVNGKYESQWVLTQVWDWPLRDQIKKVIHNQNQVFNLNESGVSHGRLLIEDQYCLIPQTLFDIEWYAKRNEKKKKQKN